ncbi:type VI secretion system protein VasG [Pseudomonas delhiensis]|uniref:Type VI secretion system protein VasG n=1 Tax=Pseudomonas delhiensis TaxID=366289 RepID=A0A239ICM7_9PSED|nr:type VI secretion system ATPase TssH [Pseudomonas delhiensis]SDK16482.1 type VI secretion system protein VasG [Pseudomonas delhiensis]SNS90164.1 type VI secretion system protein VasG [Pseudomonas delhiensis]
MAEISRNVLFSKLNRELLDALEQATALCKLRGNPYVELAHWLYQLLQRPQGDLQRVMAYFDLQAEALQEDLLAVLDRLPRGAGSVQDLGEHIDSAVERAWVFASLQDGSASIRGAHLLLGLLTTVNLRNQLRAISPQFSRINAETLQQRLHSIVEGSSESALGLHAEQAAPAQAAGQGALQRFAQDLTERARRGELDPVAGREEEIRQIIDILMRRRQNNPLLTGEAGVGKTAVVEGLALRIASGDVPAPLRGVRLCLLDIGLLQAGAGVKGEFEARLQALIEEVQASTVPTVLFIDEIHTLVGAGGTQGTGDAANLMKPALARGQLRTIGATTWSEYKKYIEKDPALTRRFQVVQVQEPDEQRALLMLRRIAAALESHHGVLLLDEAVVTAVRLSHRYIPARQLPDKAVALLDTACARVAVSQDAEPAPIEDCRQRIQALEIELEVIERERGIGLGEPEAVQALGARLEQARGELQALQLRWQEERCLGLEIIALRQALAGEPQADARDDQTEARQRLAELQEQLQALQGEAPLIFPAVDANTVAAVVCDWTGIPLGRMLKDEIQAVLQLGETLGQRVIGQRQGLDAIARRIRTSRARLDDPRKPVGVFLLCGPSGVGKTETALALAETLYGGEQNAIVLNMSEFQEAHSVSTLKGAPPGYVGYGEGGVLTEAVRRRPYSVVLLDEIEKAHPDIHEVFYQVFDKGWMEDGEGRHIDFRNSVIILTSNVGSEVVEALCREGAERPSPDALAEALRAPLLEVFPAALLGRLLVVPYYPLDDATLGEIIRLQLQRIGQRMLDNHGIDCHFDDALVQLIVSRCTEVESGGRMVDAILVNALLPQISHSLLSATREGHRYRQLSVGVEEGAFRCEFA